MKRFISFFTSAFMVITGAAFSMEGLALGVTKGLMPLLEPIAKKTVGLLA